MFSKEDYIAEVISLVKSKTARREIKRELEAHIDDRIEYYTEAGYEKDYATDKAVEKMGNPKDLAKSMEKLHNNTMWVILSMVFTSLYVTGLVVANIKAVDFAVINMVDFGGVSEFSSIVSVLIFLAGAFAFYTSKKSKSSLMLTLFGIISLATPIVSCYALIPFGYQLISIVTDFPAAIMSSEAFFDTGEVFWHIDNFFSEGTPMALYYTLVIISILISLLCVVIGIVSIAYAKELNSEKQSQGFKSRVNKFSSFVIAIAVVALLGTCAEEIYDFVIISESNKDYVNSFDDNYLAAREEFDALTIPQTTDEVKALAVEKELSDYDISDMEFGQLTVYENDACFVQISDYDDDGIYDAKRIYTQTVLTIDEERIARLESLEKGSDIYDLLDIVGYSEMSDYIQRIDGDKIISTASIYCKKDRRHYYSGDFEYENGVLVDSYIEEVEQ